VETYQTKPLSIRIEPFGECTLLPLELVPTSKKTYEKLREMTITLFDLQELPKLTPEQIQDTVKIIVHKLTKYGESITFGVIVWISGTHLSYPVINISNLKQEKEPCVTAVELYFWDEGAVLKKPLTNLLLTLKSCTRKYSQTKSVRLMMWI
jgi:hypothetical protein